MKSKNKVDIVFLEGLFRECCDPRRKQEYVDSEMISNGKTSTANMPSDGVMKKFDLNYTEKLKQYVDDIWGLNEEESNKAS